VWSRRQQPHRAEPDDADEDESRRHRCRQLCEGDGVRSGGIGHAGDPGRQALPVDNVQLERLIRDHQDQSAEQAYEDDRPSFREECKKRIKTAKA
jgi:hypothetical protein